MQGAAKGVSGGRATTRGESRADRVTVVTRSVTLRSTNKINRRFPFLPMIFLRLEREDQSDDFGR